MTSMQPFRVLIVDDHPLARKAIRSMLEPVADFEIVGEASSGEDAIVQCGEVAPDVVLMDIHMSPMDGLEATRRIKQAYGTIRIVMLTVSDDVADLFTALQFGAQGYLLKIWIPTSGLPICARCSTTIRMPPGDGGQAVSTVSGTDRKSERRSNPEHANLTGAGNHRLCRPRRQQSADC